MEMENVECVAASKGGMMIEDCLCFGWLDLGILVLGLVNFVFVTLSCPPTQGKGAQSTHIQPPNLTTASPR